MTRNILKTTVLASILACAAPAVQAATYNWDFTSFAGQSASGQLIVDASDDVTSFSGTVGGSPITAFFANPNFPGSSTLQNVVNTTGANYTYDDFFNPATNAVTQQGIAFAIGSGASEVVYDLSVDGGAPSSMADLFSITPSGGYVFDEGQLSSTAVSATPLPASWSMMIAGILALGFFAYRNKSAAKSRT